MSVIFEYAASTASSLEVRPCPGGLPLLDLGLGRQELQRAVQVAARLERGDQPAVHREHGRRLHAGVAEQHVLLVVVAQHQPGDLVGHLGEQRVAALGRQSTLADRLVEQHLDVDLVVGGVDTGAVVDRVGVDVAALAGVLDATELGQTEVAALADDLRAQGGAVDPDGVVRLVAHVGVRLAARLDVGADAAVPQQVDRSGQHRPHQLGGSHRRDAGRQAEPVTDLRRDRDRLRRARVDPAAGREQGAVVVGPGGSRQVEEPAALGVRRRGIGVRVEEHVPVVEGCDQPDVLGEQHAVAEDVARHVADAHDGEVLGLGVDADLAEVPLDRLPGAARGDAHRLVVVADRPAGGEGVAEPEPVVEGHLVRDVGERRGALVGSDHQVGVVTVVAHHLRRRDDLLDAVHRDQVVGDVEQAADERAVAGDALGQQRLAVGRRRPAAA